MLPDFWNDAAAQNMFHPASPVKEKMLRPLVVYVFLIAVLRIFGKREPAQLNPFGLVALPSLSNSALSACSPSTTLWYASSSSTDASTR
jgi:hypothetical protein